MTTEPPKVRQRFIPQKIKKTNPLLSALSLKPFFHGTPPDEGLMLSLLGLVIFGWIMVYSSSAIFAETRYHDQYYFLKRQVMWSVIGSFFFVASANISFSTVQRLCRPLYIATILSLALVLVVGPHISGAKRWLRLGVVNFQPSELAKLSLIICVADFMDRRQSRMREFTKGLFPLLLVIGVPLALILVEPDLGTPVLMMSVIISLLVLGGARWKHMGLLALSVLPVLFIALFKVRYRLLRLLAFLHPFNNSKGAGYQLVQSLLALGSGGVLGRGLGESRIKISNLPDAHTDFIFSVLGEELGLMGTLACTLLFFFLCARGLQIARKAPNIFMSLIGSGISLMIGGQALINMGVASGLFPTKGMPLPFISFGGSSLVIMMISVGLLANISRQCKNPLDRMKT
jgi:cell division protein FtsW